MDLSSQLHLAAGLGALGLGAAVLARGPARRRNRLFALLCGALAVWALGFAAGSFPWAAGFPGRMVFLLGACASGPLALHFASTVAGLSQRWKRGILPAGYVAAAALWCSAFFFPHPGSDWNLAAAAVLGILLASALAVLVRHVFSLPEGRERQAFQLVLLAGLVAVAGGLSDFLPRTGFDLPKVGPVFVLIFLVVVSAVVSRHRFLDVDVYLARVVALAAAAAATGIILFAVVRLFGTGFFTLFMASLALLALTGPLGRAVFSRAGAMLTGETEISDALVSTSRTLARAHHSDQVWEAIESGRRALPGDVHIAVYLRSAEEDRFRPAFRSGLETGPDSVAEESALPRLLEKERYPVTRRYLERGIDEEAPVRETAREALAQLASLRSELIVPLLGEERLVGWISIGGGKPERYLRSEIAASFLAVGNQAVASLQRIDAQEQAKRREMLAAIGELAAGLAHEVRNPVAAIRGAAQAIGPDATAEQAREMLEVISEETDRLGRVVGEFLDYARPGSPRREPVDLAEIGKQALRGAELAGLGLRSEIEVAPGCPPAMGDPDQIRRAFENLIRNAAEATGPGGELRVTIGPEPEGRVTARFRDNGPGIPEDEIPKLFRPFHSTKTGGTGLGLALVHRIVETHGGEIRVAGRAGEGALLTVVLPSAPS